MSLAEDLATLEPPKAAQQAFDGAQSNPFQGQNLAPWTAMRQSVALALGCQAIGLVGSAVEELAAQGTYSHAYHDAVIVLWLCAMDEAEVAGWMARRDPAAAIQAAFAWAQARGIAYGSAGHWEGIALVEKIVAEVAASFFETVKGMADGAGKKKATRPHGNSKSGSRRRRPQATRSSTS